MRHPAPALAVIVTAGALATLPANPEPTCRSDTIAPAITTTADKPTDLTFTICKEN